MVRQPLPRHLRRQRRRRNIAVAVVVVAVVALAGIAGWAVTSTPTVSSANAGDAAPVTIPKRDLTRDRVVAAFVGDTWTTGSAVGGVGADNWTSLLSTNLGWQSMEFGVAGTGYVRDGGRRSQYPSDVRVSRVVPQEPDVLVVSNGAADLDGVPVQRADLRLTEIENGARDTLRRFRESLPQTVVVVVGYIPAGDATDFIRAGNTRLAAVAGEFRVPFIDPTAPGTDWFAGTRAGLIGSDRSTPTDDGHRYLAEALTPVFERLGARDWPQVYTEWNSDNPPLPNPFVQ